MLSKVVSSFIFKVFGMTRPWDWTQFSRAIGEHSNRCIFWIYLFLGIFSANSNPLFIRYPFWWRVVCSYLRRDVLVCKRWILYSFWSGGFWSGGIVGCLLVCDRHLWWFSHLRFLWGCLKMVILLGHVP